MKLTIPIFAVLFFGFSFLTSSNCFGQINCFDSALYFNGDNQYVKLSPNDASATNLLSTLNGDYTIECMVKDDGLVDFERIFDFSYGANYFMFLTTSENVNHVPRFAISVTGLGSPQIVDATVPLNPGYNYIAVTYSKASSTVTIFINGVNEGSGFINIGADSIYHGTDMHDSSANYIGLSSFAGDPSLKGNIDEFRVSNTVRYTTDYTPGSPFTNDANTVALYHFDDGSGQVAQDASGNNYLAQLGSTENTDPNDPSWISCSGVLASDLFSFTASILNQQVQLNWSASYNVNTKYYEVERSTDAIHFNSIDKEMQSSASGNYNYKYVDASPKSGDDYYRLKQVSTSGNVVYSKAVHVNVNGLFKVYPTIATSTLHVSVSQTPSVIAIFNTDGKAVKTLTLNTSEQDINVAALPAGNYIIRNITSNSYSKFVKQ